MSRQSKQNQTHERKRHWKDQMENNQRNIYFCCFYGGHNMDVVFKNLRTITAPTLSSLFPPCPHPGNDFASLVS